MRTTLTLDDDVAAQLERLREERRLPLKELVNQALRQGLEELDAPAPAPSGPATTPVSLGGAFLPDVDDVAGTLATVEGDQAQLILVDANLLVYAHVSDFEQHAAARSWLDDRLAGPGRIGLPWESLVAFLRLVTNPRVFRTPERIDRAWQQAVDWLGAESAWIPVPTTRHWEVLESLLARTGAGGELVPDAHLAALAIEHGLELASTDGDFARFPGLRWTNPLAAT